MYLFAGQHLLSAIAEQEPYNFNTVSWNLGWQVYNLLLLLFDETALRY